MSYTGLIARENWPTASGASQGIVLRLCRHHQIQAVFASPTTEMTPWWPRSAPPKTTPSAIGAENDARNDATIGAKHVAISVGNNVEATIGSAAQKDDDTHMPMSGAENDAGNDATIGAGHVAIGVGNNFKGKICGAAQKDDDTHAHERRRK